MILWLLTANFEPLRDLYRKEINNSSIIIVDATMSRKKIIDSGRKWPNVIISDDETIQQVDQKWTNLFNSEVIPSPSLKYKSLVKNPGPVINTQ